MKKKIVFFWSRIPVYAQACLRELSRISADEIKVFSIGDPPPYFKKKLIDFDILVPNSKDFYSTVFALISEADVVVASGWIYDDFCKALLVVRKSRSFLSICMADTPWKDSFSQSSRVFLGKRKIKKMYDVMWVPGARAIPLANRLGYSGSCLWQGLYCCDSRELLKCGLVELQNDKVKKKFIFVGRLVEQKNVKLLMDAYLKYRYMIDSPWDLQIIGDGPLKSLLDDIGAGVTWHGAKEPDDVTSLMKEASCFLLPSKFEPWGVVVHEAACMALPIIASQNVCSTSELVRDGYNGRVVDGDSVDHFAQAMKWMSESERLHEMKVNSYNIAKTNTVQNWASMFSIRLEEQIGR